ncbi:hypothetical protein GJAV_G00064180 [Gymnothorax javanicus]|nr:hypothetical protein GJAV_G00064180 [Gymnothorax javanicus]
MGDPLLGSSCCARRLNGPFVPDRTSLRMAINFCPECGSKLQSGFKFCPSCGQKLPSLLEPDSSSSSPPAAPQISVTDGPVAAAQQWSSPRPVKAQQTQLRGDGKTEGPVCSVLPRLPMRRTRKCLNVTETATPLTASSKSAGAGLSPKNSLSPQKQLVRGNVEEEVEAKAEVQSSSPGLSTAAKSPKASRSPGKRQAHVNFKQEEAANASLSPSCSPKSPAAAKSRSKRMKHTPAVEPLAEGEQVTDTTGRKWKLLKLLSQSDTEIIYGVNQVTTGASSGDYKHIAKVASKDGKIFNEQNFLQRAAKPTIVKNWMKAKKMDFLGIPSCVGFGLHSDQYRFLIFPNIGQTLESVLVEGKVLSAKAVLQLSCRILDVLEYLHENEYVHADIHSANVYIDLNDRTQVYLAGYCHAFRYCPSRKHVEYREGSRTPHEGTVEFISLESHKGAGLSRRSDLQSLGYCMLSWLTGALPWSSLTDPAKVMAEKERYMTDVPGLLSQCFGRRKAPGAVQVYLSQVMSLEFTEEPKYQQLRADLLVALKKLGASLDQPIDVQV